MTTGLLIPEFDLWRSGYGGNTVTVYVAGTTTLADLFLDLACTDPADNPQVLQSRYVDGIPEPFGKFEAPVYVATSYSLSISNGDRTGIALPALASLDDVDASRALISPRSGDNEFALTDYVERRIDLLNYGDFEASGDATNNTQTLETAIGVAAAIGGAYVYLPAGTYPTNPTSLPEGVVLVGARQSATALLVQSTNAAAITIGGDGAGLRDMVLDGVNQPSGSYGVDTLGKNAVVFQDVEIRRFDTGLRMRGGDGNRWVNFSIASCNTNILLSGDFDAATNGEGDNFHNLTWIGGAVAYATEIGLELRAVDGTCANLLFVGVQFEANLGTAIKVRGTHDTRFLNCWSHLNPIALDIDDNTDQPDPAVNTVSRFEWTGGYFDGGTIDTTLSFSGTCQAVAFRQTEFKRADIDLAAPEAAIHLFDCITDAQTTVQGITQLLLRHSIDEGGTITGTSSGATTVVAWTEEVPPGESWIMDAKVYAKQSNGTDRGSWWITATIDRPAATLAYHSLAAAFTVGAIVTGETSGSSGRILDDTAGTLTLNDVTGTFTNNEVITDTSGGDARASGTLSTTGTALSASGNEDIKTPDDGFTGATVEFVANGNNAELQVTGVASADIIWTVALKTMKG